MLKKIEPRFVESVPRALDPGILYISLQFGTAVHACCCGCGEQTVTPLGEQEWSLMFDGETVSLWPSIGNWNMRCRSHYVINRNRVIEIGGMSRDDFRNSAQNRDHGASQNARAPWWAFFHRKPRL